MSSKNCPLCGKQIENENEKFCADCQNLREHYDSLAQPLSTPNETEHNEPEEKEQVSQIGVFNNSVSKKKKGRKAWTAILSILIVAILAVGAYFLVQYYYENRQEELVCWNKALKTNTGQSYMEYINQYPDGKYLKEAQANIRNYNESVKKIWNSIKANGTEEEISSFLSKYGDTPYHSQAVNLLDSVAWANALALNTQESYKSYLDRVEKKKLVGMYKPMAEERFNYFSQMEFVGGDEWKSVEKQISRFFKNISSQSYSDLETQLAPIVAKFYSLANVSPNDITTSMKEESRKNEGISISILPDTEQMRVQKDNKRNYIVELSAKKILNNKKTNEKTERKSKYRIVLDANLKIVELDENKLN